MMPSEEEIQEALKGLYENDPRWVTAARKNLLNVINSADHQVLFVLYETLHVLKKDADNNLDFISRNN